MANRRLAAPHAPATKGPHTTRRFLAPICAAVLVALVGTGCSTTHTVATPATPSRPVCQAPEAPTLPHTAGSLTERDSGAFCLPAGQVLDVFLTTPTSAAAGTRWSRIEAGDSTVLGYGNAGVLTPPMNVTPGVFVGVHAGSTTLTSALPDGTDWRVTIVVQ